MIGIYRRLVRPLLFRCDAEWVHNRAIALASMAGRSRKLCSELNRRFMVADPRLESTVAGMRFANPVGLAAGFDKNARAIEFLAALGFGYLEIGSISAESSTGNPRPRLFRLPADEAIVVNYGVPNDGAEIVSRRLAARRTFIPLGANLVETNTGRPARVAEGIQQFARMAKCLQGRADYLALNLNCPNTDGGRSSLSQPDILSQLLAVLAETANLPPVFLQVTATAEPGKIEAILQAVEPFQFVAGFGFNVPPGKNYPLRTSAVKLRKLPGSLCGRPLAQFMRQVVASWHRRCKPGRYHLMGVGGIFTADDAYDLVRQGASLVQIYTSLVYRGPGVVREINQGLAGLLERDGFSSISAAVGTAEDVVRA
jgi:dihydroorotate dehydrogenase (fumarate)/dihydroorotate dehydrogenase